MSASGCGVAWQRTCFGSRRGLSDEAEGLLSVRGRAVKASIIVRFALSLTTDRLASGG